VTAAAPTPAPNIVVAAGGIVVRDDTVLLVQRGRPPAAGKWSVPGGRVHPGERLADAVIREVFEETGLRVRVERFAGWAERIGADPAPYHHVIFDYFVTETAPGEARAGDDAAAVAWVALTELDTYDLVDGLSDFFTEVGLRPSVRG
jgi:8-oxo-dGTP diphosphatase